MTCPVPRPECSCSNCTTAMIRAHAPHLLTIAPSPAPVTPASTPSTPDVDTLSTGTGYGRKLIGPGVRGNGGRLYVLEEDRGFKTPCWIWQLSKRSVRPGREGYGRITRLGVAYPAHRYCYEQRQGSIPEGLQIDHLCHQTLCVNPDHLEAVTASENVRRGSNSKLSEDEVRAILSSDESDKHLAKRYGVVPKTVYEIRRGIKWADVFQEAA